ncbi:MAG TPA: hypothetical protein VJZ91_15075 [Blastocatellia bacterium]|nr:hypothetical protein [Blastocatellia bacterium]
MTDQNDDDDNALLITAYLLGELSTAEQEKLEARYFLDDALFERLLATEDDLIDRYARGRMSDQERERCERHFLKSPARRKRVGFERLLPHQAAVPAAAHHRRLSCWRALRDLMRPKSPR